MMLSVQLIWNGLICFLSIPDLHKLCGIVYQLLYSCPEVKFCNNPASYPETNWSWIPSYSDMVMGIAFTENV